MLLAGVLQKEFSQFNGAITRLDPYSVDSTHGIYAQNVSYVRGEVGTRFGHSAMFTNSDSAITAMVNWYFSYLGTQISVALYYAPAVGVRGYQLITNLFSVVLMAQTAAAGAVMIPAGLRLYAAFYDATGRLGSAGGQVYGWDSNAADPLFAAPMTYTPTVSETGAGVVTAGAHRIGYLTTTRNGYTGKPSPTIAGTFTPASFTSTGGKNLRVQVAGALPSYMVNGSIQVVMTTVANPNRYFTVPGASANAFNPTTITLSISDDDLAATGTDVTDRITLITCSSTTGPPFGDPFKPSAMFTYSSRMGYIAFDGAGFPVIYFSNQNDFQFITADQHGVYLEGQQQAVQGFSMRGVCYIGTPSAFYSVEDNGGVPATWIPPQKVDGSIGILSPTCLTVNPSLGYAAIAADRGLYLFQGGIFPALPLSYYQQSDWARINWQVPTTVQVVDDQLNKRFIVQAPLSNTVASVTGTGPYTVTTTINPHLYQTGLSVTLTGVTGAHPITVTGPATFTIPGGSGAPTVGGTILPQTASHQMSWDYTEGDTPETVKYSLNGFASYRAGAVAVIQNIQNYLSEIWYAPAANGPVIRQNDGTEANPFRDVDMSGNPAAINSFPGYQTSLIPGADDSSMTVHGYDGMHTRVRGSGNLQIAAVRLDNTRTVTPATSPLALQAAPGQEILVKWWDRADQATIQVGTNGLDQFFVLSLIRAYYRNEFPQR